VAEHAERVRDVAGDAAALDDEVVDQEGQRDAVDLVGEELGCEPARKMHQVVGRDGPRHGDRHVKSAYRVVRQAVR
jgi:hypothetical protein